jgi:hypothetical protein
VKLRIEERWALGKNGNFIHHSNAAKNKLAGNTARKEYRSDPRKFEKVQATETKAQIMKIWLLKFETKAAIFLIWLLNLETKVLFFAIWLLVL